MPRLPAPKAVVHRRVVVTGLGAVTPLGAGADLSWQRLLRGDSGITALGGAYASLPSRIAAIVPRGSGDGQFDASAVIDKSSARTQSPDFIAFALAAALEALRDAGLLGEHVQQTDVGSAAFLGPYSRDRVGVAIGSGIGAIEEIGGAGALLASGGDAAVRRMSPFFVPRILTNMAAGNVSIAHRLRGPNVAPATACATGAHAIGDAFRLIQHGDADAMLAGGTEACVCPLAVAGFSRLRALATRFNDDPRAASRPFDSARDGFVLGEGAGVLVLEEMEHARSRGARIYAEIRGYGLCGDAHHVTSPAEDGSGAARCMSAAIAEAGLQPLHVDYVNAHATSTPVGDAVEAAGLARVFRGAAGARQDGRRVSVSSTKGAIGHLLGAAGAVEAIAAVLAIHSNTVPATLNLTDPDSSLPTDACDFVSLRAQQRDVAVAMSNSFGFGGTNASLLFARHEP